VLYLPPYSPDLDPIENLFAKMKGELRKLIFPTNRFLEAYWLASERSTPVYGDRILHDVRCVDSNSSFF